MLCNVNVRNQFVNNVPLISYLVFSGLNNSQEKQQPLCVIYDAPFLGRPAALFYNHEPEQICFFTQNPTSLSKSRVFLCTLALTGPGGLRLTDQRVYQNDKNDWWGCFLTKFIKTQAECLKLRLLLVPNNEQASGWLGVFTNAIREPACLSPFHTNASWCIAYRLKARKTKVPSRDQRPSLTHIENKKSSGWVMELAHDIKNGNPIYTCKLAHVLFLKESCSYVWKCGNESELLDC